ncbi:MAG TPA: type III-B CRISPR-associated protein Cas10/Cmr2, partial [Ktedonobacteraceae bacterium]|nr:type III-B CRISPR-associated protein Cas10/Cmr2 [Ktedonobacteraceae bacterium]
TPVPHLLMGDRSRGSQENYDGSLLLEGRLVDVIYAPGEDTKKRSERWQKARLALEAFYEEFDLQCVDAGLAKARPDTYYAFLQADGDGMGELINAQAERGYKQHRAFSQKLSNFAMLAREIVEKHRGALVYAGGDDVVALLPLDTVLKCASELAEAFRTILQDFALVDAKGQKRMPSLSAGVAIAHHLESLQQVRQLAKQAEDRAKCLEGKNALAITLSKRSGEDYGIAGHWDDLDISLQRLVDFAARKAIPTGTAYELRDLLLRLGVLGEETHTSSQRQVNSPYTEVVERDALRIIKRKLSVPRGKFPPEQIEEITRFFKARLGIEQPPHSDRGHIRSVALSELINELIVAQVLADAKEVATPTKKERSQV